MVRFRCDPDNPGRPRRRPPRPAITPAGQQPRRERTWPAFLNAFLTGNAAAQEWLKCLLERSPAAAMAERLFHLGSPASDIEAVLLRALLDSGL